MLDHISPFQFVDGINDGERVTGNFDAQGTRLFALSITPLLTFALKAIGLFCTYRLRGDYNQSKITVRLFPDYADNPSDVELCTGDLPEIDEREPAWHMIDFTRPAVVVKSRKYWIGFEATLADLEISRVKDGIDCELRFSDGQIWTQDSAHNIQTIRPKIRLFGRILPVIS